MRRLGKDYLLGLALGPDTLPPLAKIRPAVPCVSDPKIALEGGSSGLRDR